MDALASDNTAWPAPAKLNRMLRIVGRRADGYHLLQTVFQFVERCDWLSFTPRPDGVIERLVGIERTIGSVVYSASEVTSPGVVSRSKRNCAPSTSVAVRSAKVPQRSFGP